METVRILIALSSEAAVAKLKAILVEYGYMIVGYASEGNECLRKVRTLRPDVVVLDQALPSMTGYEVGKIAVGEGLCDVILIVGTGQAAGIPEGLTEEGIVCMGKPLNRVTLINTIDMMAKAKRKITKLEKEILELKSTLDTRKEVEKAKGLLMRHMNISENEAFKKIQKQSMDKGIPMKEIAKAIILAYDI